MESELKKIQDIAIKAYNGVMEDREADEAIREILAKYGIPKEKSKNVTAEQLYSTRLVHAERDTKDGKTQKNVKTSAESFLVEEWSKAYLCASQDEPIGRLKKKLGMTEPTLYELVAGAFLLVLQNASADWVKVYVAPLKEEITGKEEHKFGYATSHWDGELVKKISREELKASWEKMSEQSADAQLRQAVKEYNEPMLRELLSAKDQVNEYLKASQNFVSKGIKNDYGTTEEDKKIAGTINSNPTPNTDAIRVVSEFFENWEYGLGWLDAPNKRSEKLPYRVIRHLFFLMLGLNDPLYGSAEDMRTLLIQLGFALGMKSTEIDTLLKDSGLAGIDYKANEIILAYAADHFKENAYLHARALQKIYELQNRTTVKEENKADTVVLKQTVFYQYSYTKAEWSKLEPSAFLAQCQKDNIAWRRVQDLINPPKQRKKTSLKAESSNAELQESSEQMTNIVIYSSQLFEIRKILIDLYLMIKIDEEENLKKKEEWKKLYDEINRAYENKLLSLNHSTNFSDESAGWKKFLQWNKNISHPIPIKIEEKYPFGVDEMGQKDDPERGNESLIYRRIKDAENCVKMAKYLLRDDFLRLAFWDYLITEPSKNLRGKKPMEIMQSFANREKPVLERCRLKPYNPDKDALTQDFIRAVENRKKEAL
jgi:hypothetical protein